MGAEVFMNWSKGATVREAFDKTVKQAQYDHGHAGYTGTIAEKDSYVEIKIPADFMPKVEPKKRAEAYANKLINDQDDRIDDKWGPAGAIVASAKNREVLCLFFGWSSS